MRRSALRILILTKRQYMNKDLLDDRYGRLREIPYGLAQKGHHVRGLCLSYADRKEGFVQDGAVQWKSVNATPLKLPGLIRFIREASLLAQDADVIWAGSDSFYGVIACFLGRKHGVPVVFDLYDNFGYFLAAKLPVIKQLYRYALRNCDAVTCNGRALARLIRSYGRQKRIDVLETVGRTDLFRPMDRRKCREKLKFPLDAKIVGTAGALYRNRGIHLLFDAFRRLRKKYPDLYLALAGPREEGIEIPYDCGVLDVGILPFEDVPVFVNALDVAVICNLNNEFGKYCFPQKAWEIMACDVPLIAAGVEGMKEFFMYHPEWLYEPDSSEELIRALEKRLSDGTTGYDTPPSWSDLAAKLESVMLEMCR